VRAESGWTECVREEEGGGMRNVRKGSEWRDSSLCRVQYRHYQMCVNYSTAFSWAGSDGYSVNGGVVNGVHGQAGCTQRLFTLYYSSLFLSPKQ